MANIILYHGTAEKIVSPSFGLGNEKHDYGKGFYLTESVDLAKEWAVCRPNEQNGWIHKFEFNLDDIKILDFQQINVLAWLAELMKHRDASDSKRYRLLSKKFIEKYGIDTSVFDEILVSTSENLDTSSMYAIFLPKETEIAKAEAEMKSFFEKYDQAWIMGYFPEEEKLVKNRLEEKYGNYYIYIISKDNETVLKKIK